MDSKSLQKIANKFKDQNILVIGDLMIDHYIKGHIERISPEAPVPIANIESEEYRLGGAANVAANITSLSGNVTLLGFMGEDIEGQKLMELAKKNQINLIPSYIPEFPTTTKTRIISGNQQILRLDREKTSEKFFSHDLIKKELKKTDLIIISDYAKGSITPDLMALLTQDRKKIIIDPKPKNKHLYKNSFLITPNKKEAIEMSLCYDINKAGQKLKKELLSNVIITLGEEGMSIFKYKANGFCKNIPTYAKEVYDVTGAGDSVIATLGLSISAGSNLEEAAILANHSAGIVVAKHGTSRATLSELEEKLFFESKKIKTLAQLEQIIPEYKKQNKKIVWTNGCFDLLHTGHIDNLKKAKEFGDYLIVGLNSDESVRKLKGEKRPILPESERAEIISTLGFVDYVTIFSEKNSEKYLQALKPQIFAKGGDYTLKSMNQIEKNAVHSYGGRIEFIPFKTNISTSKIIEKIRE